jgi:RHS repeat-associated protein
MAELLTITQRAGLITIRTDPSKTTSPVGENVYPGVLEASVRMAYNVPVLPLTRLSRTPSLQTGELTMSDLTRESANISGHADAESDLAAYCRIDDEQLAVEYSARRERNNQLAISVGLPTVGAKMLNKYGIEWVVESHVYVPTPGTINRWRAGEGERAEDLYPSVVPLNLSSRFNEFIGAVDRCTTKTFVLLDTTPELRPSAVQGSHSLDTIGDTGANLVFIDAARLHETVLAHEIGHAWTQYVDQCEDERVMEEVSDPQRLHQLHFVQSFVLDLKVNDLIRRKGFDMSPIGSDQAASILSLCQALESGYRPPNRREEVFMALLLASQMLEEDSGQMYALVNARNAVTRIMNKNEGLAYLAERFAGAVRSHGFSNRDAIRRAIDDCLTIAFEFTGDGIDLDNDLVTPDAEEPNFDKYPEWIHGVPVRLKVDVGRIMARESIPAESRWSLSCGPDGQTLLGFELPGGMTCGPWELDYPYPFDRTSEALRLMAINRLNRERLMSLTPQVVGHSPANSGVPSYNHRRHYMAGLGRFLTQARLEEQLRGEHAYGYALNNPVTMTDPSGLYPKVNCHSNPSREKDLRDAVKKVCDALKGAGVSGLEGSKCLNRSGQAQCMVDWCNHSKSTVNCGNLGKCPAGRCAYSYGASGPGKGVYVCADAWDNPGCKKWPCASLVGNILHEIVGLCGTPHEGGGDDFPDPCDFRANCLCDKTPGLL